VALAALALGVGPAGGQVPAPDGRVPRYHCEATLIFFGFVIREDSDPDWEMDGSGLCTTGAHLFDLTISSRSTDESCNRPPGPKLGWPPQHDAEWSVSLRLIDRVTRRIQELEQLWTFHHPQYLRLKGRDGRNGLAVLDIRPELSSDPATHTTVYGGIGGAGVEVHKPYGGSNEPGFSSIVAYTAFSTAVQPILPGKPIAVTFRPECAP
jgi:hypothetical protein